MDHLFSSRITVASGVLFRLVGEEAVLLNLNTEVYLGLDAVGTRMWKALVEASSIEAAYDGLLGEDEVKSARLYKELDEFVGKLLEQGLIESSPAELAIPGRFE